MPDPVANQAAAAISIGQAVTVYGLFLPPLTEVRRSVAEDPVIRADVRMGQLGASVVVISVGFVLSDMAGSMVPVGISVFMAGIMAAVYETAMRQNGEL